MPSNHPLDSRADAARFITRLNDHHEIPPWSEAAALGVPLIDLAYEERAARQSLSELEQINDSLDPASDPDVAAATAADMADTRERLDQIGQRPGRYFLASGATIQRDTPGADAHQTGWWYDDRCTRIDTPNGERIHRPGIHPYAAIHPNAHIEPTARIESGVTVGPNAHIGAHAHIGRDAIIGAHTNIQPGAWVGTGADVGPHAWVSPGAMIEPRCTIGHHTTIGAGSRVTYRAEIEPYSRLGAGTTSNTNNRTPRNTHIAGVVEQLMRLDRE